eukprot:3435718-Pleurochrysis_carterae.AAC.1
MHSFPNWTCVACVYLRSARAPLSKLSDTHARDGCRCPLSRLPRATAQARPIPRARASSRSSTVCTYLNLSFPARPDGRNSKHAWLRRAWSLRVGFDGRLGLRTTFERRLCIASGGAAWTGEVQRTGVSKRVSIAEVSDSDTPADLYRLFSVWNWRPSRAAEALCRPERSPGASTGTAPLPAHILRQPQSRR